MFLFVIVSLSHINISLHYCSPFETINFTSTNIYAKLYETWVILSFFVFVYLLLSVAGLVSGSNAFRLPQSSWTMMMILRQWRIWLLWWTALDSSIRALNWRWSWCCCWRLLHWCSWLSFFASQLTNFDIWVNCAHAEVEIRAVLLVVLWTCVGLDFSSRFKQTAGSTALFFFDVRTNRQMNFRNEFAINQKHTKLWLMSCGARKIGTKYA